MIEVVEYIEQRLEDLGDEKEELKEFQTLDRDKRALEYTIYDQVRLALSLSFGAFVCACVLVSHSVFLTVMCRS